MFVDPYPAPFVRHDPDALEAKAVGGPLAPGGVHHDVARHHLPAGQRRQCAAFVGLDGLHRFPEPEGDSQAPEVELQSLDHFLVAELEHPLPLLDHRDFGTEGGEQGRVLDADHPGDAPDRVTLGDRPVQSGAKCAQPALVPDFPRGT